MSDADTKQVSTINAQIRRRKVVSRVPAELVEWTDGSVTVEHDGKVIDVGKKNSKNGNFELFYLFLRLFAHIFFLVLVFVFFKYFIIN